MNDQWAFFGALLGVIGAIGGIIVFFQGQMSREIKASVQPLVDRFARIEEDLKDERRRSTDFHERLVILETKYARQ